MDIVLSLLLLSLLFLSKRKSNVMNESRASSLFHDTRQEPLWFGWRPSFLKILAQFKNCVKLSKNIKWQKKGENLSFLCVVIQPPQHMEINMQEKSL